MMKFFYLVHAYFFAHHHIHRRKIEFLRKSGIDAKILSCVDENLYAQNESRYRECLKQGFVKLFVGSERRAYSKLKRFLLTQSLISKKVIVQVLRSNPDAVIAARNSRMSRGRIRFVMEFEGDQPLEFIYQEKYLESPRPPEVPDVSTEQEFYSLLESQKSMLKVCDGAVLVSEEHHKLWNKRLDRSLNVCLFPTIPHCGEIEFETQSRDEIRSLLGIDDKVVLTYSGNVICKWQRLDAMCAFISRLKEKCHNIHLLLIVRRDDLQLAMNACEAYGLHRCSTILNVGHNEIAKYYSASDVGLFLRHDHGMNRIVTSGKICEYLASGLSVLTTGSNASIVNKLIRSHGHGFFISDSLSIESFEMLHEFLERSKNVSSGERILRSDSMNRQFAAMRIYEEHLNFISGL